MTSRYDAKHLRGSGLRRRPLASPSHAEIDPRGTCRSIGDYRRPSACPKAGRDVYGFPIAPPGAVVPGRTRSGSILDSWYCSPPHWSLMPQDLVRASEDRASS